MCAFRETWKNPARIENIGKGGPSSWSFIAPDECEIFFARIKKNMKYLRNVFSVNCRTHITHRLRRLVEEEVRALPS
jgi:hypothetical protein